MSTKYALTPDTLSIIKCFFFTHTHNKNFLVKQLNETLLCTVPAPIDCQFSTKCRKTMGWQ